MVQRIVAYHLYRTAVDMDIHVSEDEYEKEAGKFGRAMENGEVELEKSGTDR